MNGIDEIWYLRIFMVGMMGVGGTISYYALLTWRESGLTSMLYFGSGFALITVGAALSGMIYEILTHDLLTAWIVYAALEAAGFAVILLSLFAPLQGTRGAGGASERGNGGGGVPDP